jgi:hypothetical protein
MRQKPAAAGLGLFLFVFKSLRAQNLCVKPFLHQLTETASFQYWKVVWKTHRFTSALGEPDLGEKAVILFLLFLLRDGRQEQREQDVKLVMELPPLTVEGAEVQVAGITRILELERKDRLDVALDLRVEPHDSIW